MRLTVKYLQEQLENEKQNSNRYYKLWQEAKNELSEKEQITERFNYQKQNYQE